jgi:hypothetical protein
MEKSLKTEDIKSFIFAGKSIFTILNTKTGNRFTFKINKSKNNDIYFVSVLSGSNNETDYTFFGYIKSNNLHLSKKTTFTSETTSFKVFDWFLKNHNNLPSFIDVLHMGKCGRCGRTLTTPESIERGIGPECSRLMK